MLSLLLGWLGKVKATVEAVLAQFPASGPALATIVADLVSRFGVHIVSNQVAIIWGALAAILGALTAHSLRKAAAPAKK